MGTSPYEKRTQLHDERLQTMDPEVLNVEGVAQLLGVAPTTVAHLARRGKIPGLRVGREWRFYRQAILMTLAGQTVVTVE